VINDGHNIAKCRDVLLAACNVVEFVVNLDNTHSPARWKYLEQVMASNSLKIQTLARI
jgi:hypothetical protein